MRSTVASRSSRSASARKPTWPRLTPSSGHARAAGELGAAQDGAVAAEDADQLAARRPLSRAVGGVAVGRRLDAGDAASGGSTSLVGRRADADARRDADGWRRRRPAAGLRPADVGHEQDAARRLGRHRRPPLGAVRGGRAHGVGDPVRGPCVRRHRARTTGGTRCCPLVPLIGLAAMPCTCSPCSPAARATWRRRRRAVLRVDDDPLPSSRPADLELRLDEQHEVARPGAAGRRGRR